MPLVPDYRRGGGTGRKVPKGRSRTLGCLGLLLTVIGLPVVGGVAVRVAYRIAEPPVLDMLYGAGTYAKGVRVVGKHGELSDGRRIPESWNFALVVGSGILMLPAVVMYIVLLKSFGLWPDESDVVYE